MKMNFQQILFLLATLGSCSCTLMDELMAEIPRDRSNLTVPLTPCEEQLIELIKAADQQQSWALKALDASPGDLSNFMLGQSHFLGNAATCRAVNEPILKDFTDHQPELLRETAPFEFKYQMAYIEANSPWQLRTDMIDIPMLHVGLCLPQTCQTEEVEKLLNNSFAHGEIWQRWQMKPKLVYTKRPELGSSFFQSALWKLFLLCLSLNVLLTLLGNTSFGAKYRFLGCFNVRTNWQRLFKDPEPDKENSAINGIRVTCAFLLLAFHVVWYKFFAADSSYMMMEKVASMLIRNSYWPFVMEIFFVISGFLTVSNFLSNTKKQQTIAEDHLSGNIVRYLRQVLHRYLRLVPLEFVVLLTSAMIFSYLRQVSIYHLVEPVDELCSKFWWRNVLFIQNLFWHKDMCCNWTWSLACDMQIYLVALTLLFIHTRHPKLIRTTVGCLFAGNVLFSLWILRHATPHFESFYVKGDIFYVSPMTRFYTYAVGVVYGYWDAKKLPMSPFHYVFGQLWQKLALAGVCLLLVARFQYGDLPSIGLVILAIFLLRLVIAAIAAEIMLSNSKEDLAKYWQWVLNLFRTDWVQKTSRVTYAIYLLNPTVIISCFYLQSQTLEPDNITLILLVAAHSLIIYLLAILFTVFIEYPYNGVCNMLLNPSTKTKST
ncbi:uncharacterized protein Dwil_GK16203 [Drosophila willistoni]|uniref:Nose resistant-to-fluoxetine protein N-terminal domain-containing protein n=1 Tax=Drosophila willistoni TaxID=7260 RepID=B4N205_DROWI|nr:O-acyltransferase like protein [Drosophila willistoni]EDW78394.1 uncharacterized protein Dwil_GK16203 [Drosophila willistoni]